MNCQHLLAATAIVCAFSACTPDQKISDSAADKAAKPIAEPAEPALFTLLAPEQTGVDYVNMIHENWEHNIFNYDYMYNGAGVAVGDINNDGLQDLFFTGNMSSNALYLNKGDWQFENITESAGLTSEGWSSGVTMVDINQDGLLDMYVCRSYYMNNPELRKNLLYINNGDNTFSERAAEFGLDLDDFSVQSAFFDYDKDGDLDLYLANHMTDFRDGFSARIGREPVDDMSDKLFRNDGTATNPKFTDVGKAAGIWNYGCGLGVAIGDVNQDGWPDVYVSNDYEEPDLYYVNNGDGTFSERMQEHFKHIAWFGMGTALADYNNDALADLVVLDMVAEDNYRQKTMMAPMNVDKFWRVVDAGYHYQYMRNVLQVNNGNGSFSEVGYLAGISNTDWSWAPLMADFDNDGWKDLYITNGFRRDSRNKDAAHKIDEFVAAHGGRMYREFADSMLNMFPSKKVVNYYYANNGDLTFDKATTQAGFSTPSFSNGAVYADLDGDGDLDVVVSNLLDPAFIYRNNAREQNRGNYLRVDLQGNAGNSSGLGAQVTIEHGESLQWQEQAVTRGYLSSVERTLHFGLGERDKVDRLLVKWPDGSTQELSDVAANQTLTLKQADADKAAESNSKKQGLFADVSKQSKLDFEHSENEYDDYAKEILLPHKMSQFGPALATGDVNGDGLEDVFLGGAAFQESALYFQQKNGTFKLAPEQPWAKEANREDVGAALFDADGDNDLDLYLVRGGNEFEAGSPLYNDRLFINDGTGKLQLLKNQFTEAPISGSCVVPGDVDGDGDLDLFVGGRVVPGQYPFPSASHILENNNGRFSDVTSDWAPELLEAGLVTSAVWQDYDNNGTLDLIVAGEWMPIRVFSNSGSALKESTAEAGLAAHSGWWNRIEAADLDGDGDMDFVAGNLGLNYKYKASEKEPFHVYCHDFDATGTLDIVLGYFNNGECFPVRGRQCSSEQMPVIKKKFPSYEDFGKATLQDVYGSSLDEALHRQVTNFSTSWIENKGDGTFEVHALPLHAQFSTVNGIVIHDFNADGNKDILLAGNFYMSEIETGRADAGTGLLLTGNGAGEFTPMAPGASGFIADRDVRNIAMINTKEGQQPLIIVANNDDAVQVFKAANAVAPATLAQE